MNLASLIGSDYDSVIFNSVSYVPEILVNVTLDWNGRAERIVKVLGNLAKHNDTLLDLSGSHFNVTRYLLELRERVNDERLTRMRFSIFREVGKNRYFFSTSRFLGFNCKIRTSRAVREACGKCFNKLYILMSRSVNNSGLN